MERMDTETASAPDVRYRIVADVQHLRGVKLLFGQKSAEQIFGLACPVIAGGIKEVPAQLGSARAQQCGQLLGVPVGVRHETYPQPEAPGLGIERGYVGVDEAQIDLGAEFGGDEVRKGSSMEAEQPKRKPRVDIRDRGLRRSVGPLRLVMRHAFGLLAMLHEGVDDVCPNVGDRRIAGGELVDAVGRRASAQQKCIEDIERDRAEGVRAQAAM